jgi:lysine-specific histone demethylase 1
VNASTSSRGELFLFWCFTKPPVLIALVAGDAANVVECATDDVIIGRTLVVLRNIFGSVTVPSVRSKLIEFRKIEVLVYLAKRIFSHSMEIRSICTWFVFICCCWRFRYFHFFTLKKNSIKFIFQGDDYDILSRPVEYPGDKIPRLYFAGEHTNRNYPATVHGALLSGLREARRIADAFLGSIYEISAP